MTKKIEKDLEWIFSKKGVSLKSNSSKNLSKDKIVKSLYQININASPVVLKITSHTHVKTRGVMAHLKYLSRDKDNEDGGKYKLYDKFGQVMDEEAMERFNEDVLLKAKAFSKHKNGRVTTNLMITKPHLSTSEEFKNECIEWMDKNFRDNDYVYTFHDDSTEHIHIAVGYFDDVGKPLNPRKGDILSWKESFSEIVNRERDIPLVTALSASSRGKLKTGYKRSIVKATEKGIINEKTKTKASLEEEKKHIQKKRNALLRLYYYAKDDAKDAKLTEHLADQVKYFDQNYGTAFKKAHRKAKSPSKEDQER